MSSDRNKDLALIHIGKKQLQMDDDAYRDLLWTLGRVRSAGKLDDHGREAVIQHMKHCGFTPVKAKPKTGQHGTPPHNLKSNPQMQKIEALLADAKRPWDYVQSMAQRMYQKDDITFCSPAELSGIIAALVKDKQRRAQRVKA